MTEVLVLANFNEDLKEKIVSEAGEQCHVSFGLRTDKDLSDKLKNAEYVIGEPAPELLSGASSLKVLQMTWAGTDLYTERTDFPQNVTLLNASGCFGTVIAEYVIGAILLRYRRFAQYYDQQKEHLWKDAGAERTLEGATALILGTGDIGKSIAKRLKAFDVYTIGIRRNKLIPEEFFDEICGTEALCDQLSRADLIICCMPNTSQTKGLLGKKEFLCMKKTAVFVNVGRGSLFAPEELLGAMQEGSPQEAILDVEKTEPLPAESPLWDEERITITPHISGPSLGHDKKTEEKIVSLCLENLKRYLSGKELKNVVDFRTGYRKSPDGGKEHA